MGKRPVEIVVTPRQQVLLKRTTRSIKAAPQLVARYRVVFAVGRRSTQRSADG